jgi:MFS family permease
MLGLFLLLPVLVLYASGLPDATPLQIGLAMGAFPLVQALLQIPFGLLSDRFGRRGIITLGLVFYAVGSVMGGLATGITALIAARLVQGAGAISGPVSALLADLTRPEIRTRAMALIGISIGGSFVISLVVAPPLQAVIGVRGIFWIMAALAVICLLLLHAAVPRAESESIEVRRPRPRFSAALTPELMPYYIGVFVLNLMLTSTFVGVPHALSGVLNIPLAAHWKTYLWVFMASVPLTVPLVLRSEKAGQSNRVTAVAIALMAASLFVLVVCHQNYLGLGLSMVVFFAGFNFLEARIPARLSQSAPAEVRGAALGMFATAQNLGSYAGSQIAPVLYASRWGLSGVFAVGGAMALVWLVALRVRRL